MARKLFDTGIFSALAANGGFASAATLAFYGAGGSSPITTYNAASGGSANTNPVTPDANGRFDEIWIEDSQSIKYIFTAYPGAVGISVDNVLIAADAPPISGSLYTFLLGSGALPIANGGTNAVSAADALVTLGALPVAGGTVTDDIARSGQGVYLHHNDAGCVNGGLFITAAATADPTSLAGQIWAKY